MKCFKYALFSVLLISTLCIASDNNVLLHEDFKDLSKWIPLTFPKIESHSLYTAESNGTISYLKASSSNSASALLYKETFNVYDYPKIKWTWKVDNVYKKAVISEKSGDDYPIRLYIMFQYDPSNSTFFEKIKYKTAKLIYGQYPPLAGLNYVWSSQETTMKYYASPYTDKAIMFPLEKGSKNIGKWITESVDLLEDYREVFKKEPPKNVSIAIMSDSDNTKESAISYITDIEIFK